MRISAASLVLCVFLLTLGCASGGGGEGSSTDRNRISAEEIQDADASDLYELVERLRPRWLQIRSVRSVSDLDSVSILVYEGNARLGGPDQLRGMRLSGVEALEYLDGPTASATLSGVRGEHVAGAIVIHR